MTTFTETKTVDQITVVEDGTVFYRETIRILKDGDEIAKTYHRTSLTPAQDLTGVPDSVVAICNVAWTEEVKTAYRAMVEAQKALKGA